MPTGQQSFETIIEPMALEVRATSTGKYTAKNGIKKGESGNKD